MNPILSGVLSLVAIIALMVPISLYFAWAASILWGWFVAPALSVPTLTIWQAWGITLALSMLRPKIQLEKRRETDWGGGLTALIIGPPLAVGFGYAIKHWWM